MIMSAGIAGGGRGVAPAALENTFSDHAATIATSEDHWSVRPVEATSLIVAAGESPLNDLKFELG
jgi:hypothetical protein